MRRAFVAAALVAAVLAPAGSARGAEAKLIVVPRDAPSITEAVEQASAGDFILVGPGTYHEAVTVETPDLTIRGTDREEVILDGERQLINGIYADEVNGVSVANMTGRNYLNNAFYWEGVVGYEGRFLTAQDNAYYGVYAFDSYIGVFSDSDASGNGDSGFYVGQCHDCKALIERVRAHHNGLGYSGTNAGGVVISNSEWDNNVTGIVPNTLPTEDAFPQGGRAGAIITGNYVHDNNNAGAPSTFSIAGLGAPLGIGIDIAGGWNNIVIGNRVEHHGTYGIGIHWLTTPTLGNEIRNNHVSDSGEADLAWDGIGAANCWDGNENPDGELTSEPPMIETLHQCGVSSPVGGDPVAGLKIVLNAAGITDPRNHGQPQPRASGLPSMPDPCEGAPDGCAAALAELRGTAPIEVSVNPAPHSDDDDDDEGSASAGKPQTSPPSAALVVSGLTAPRPSNEEIVESFQRALASVNDRPLRVVVPAPEPDLVGGAVIAMLAIAAALFLAAAAGRLRRRRA